MWKCEETPLGGVATKGTVPKFVILSSWMLLYIIKTFLKIKHSISLFLLFHFYTNVVVSISKTNMKQRIFSLPSFISLFVSKMMNYPNYDKKLYYLRWILKNRLLGKFVFVKNPPKSHKKSTKIRLNLMFITLLWFCLIFVDFYCDFGGFFTKIIFKNPPLLCTCTPIDTIIKFCAQSANFVQNIFILFALKSVTNFYNEKIRLNCF